MFYFYNKNLKIFPYSLFVMYKNKIVLKGQYTEFEVITKHTLKLQPEPAVQRSASGERNPRAPFLLTQFLRSSLHAAWWSGHALERQPAVTAPASWLTIFKRIKLEKEN